MSDLPVTVECPKCGEQNPASDAEVGGSIPVRCRRCAYVWKPFGDQPSPNDLPKTAP